MSAAFQSHLYILTSRASKGTNENLK